MPQKKFPERKPLRPCFLPMRNVMVTTVEVRTQQGARMCTRTNHFPIFRRAIPCLLQNFPPAIFLFSPLLLQHPHANFLSPKHFRGISLPAGESPQAELHSPQHIREFPHSDETFPQAELHYLQHFRVSPEIPREFPKYFRVSRRSMRGTPQASGENPRAFREMPQAENSVFSAFL